MRNYYKSGDWNVICDVCGKKMKSSHAKKRWDGLIVCSEDYEQRHSLDFIRVKPDKQTVPFSRPRSTDTLTDDSAWINTLGCTPMGSSGKADYAVADCAMADKGFM